jgi:hypothetical protein
VIMSRGFRGLVPVKLPQVTVSENQNIEFVSANSLTSESQSQTYGVPLVPTPQNQNMEFLTPHPHISEEPPTSVTMSISQNQIYETPSVSRSQQLPTEITKFLLKKDLLLS